MIVFTNGCFDIIHPGHVDLLTRAKALGDKLIVGINSDRSVSAIKGPGRPLQDQEARKAVLLGLSSVDEVIIYDELTPEETIKQTKPDILVKGDDWKKDEIIGADFVKANGGQVVSLSLVSGFSTSSIAEKMGQSENNSQDDGGSTATRSLNEHLGVFQAVLNSGEETINACADLLLDTFNKGNKVLKIGRAHV